ncbi:alpha/beta hydrolase fold domain-containing protein [Promicromonospora panici]|uniref:alpha/beta hydrolase fold domain-containing protein n=1 Tax=Promicromonospora panici TaxID=2219658 RepID=UPI00101BC33F|nr:alpha/beta hydrolase fold domain-containing protein [Promicromonospora panici]
MSVLSSVHVASAVALGMQRMSTVGLKLAARGKPAPFPEYPADVEEISVPTALGPARAFVYRPAGRSERPSVGEAPNPPVHVNFHGGGYVMRDVQLDDPLCRYLAAEAGVVVVNVDYVVAPQHRFPAAPHQAYEVVRWVAEHGDANGWDGIRLTVGGQSAGGALAAAVARQALEHGDPAIGLQVLHYPPLDLVTHARDKVAAGTNPMIKPWMGDVFDNAYIPDPAMRSDRLASPANPADDADLTGIAPAVVLTCELDRLRGDGEAYAVRLRAVGALVAHVDIAGADHAYDMDDLETARRTYAFIAERLREVAQQSAPSA